jgi:hypothetical protein
MTLSIMSDGPFRSLNLRRWWKAVAERADLEASDCAEISELIEIAIEKSWKRDVPKQLLDQVVAILYDRQSSLFSDTMMARLEALRPNAAGHAMGQKLLASAIYLVEAGQVSQASVSDLVETTVRGAVADHSRSIVDHCLRKSSSTRALGIRNKIESGMMQIDVNRLVSRFTNGSSITTKEVRRHDGLDDGVSMK